MKKMERIIYIITIVILMFFVSQKEVKENNEINNIEKKINKNGEEESKTIVIIESKKELLNRKDSIITSLRQIVRDYKGRLNTAIATSTETYIETVTETVVDTVNGSYNTSWNDKWSSGYILATKDSIYKKIKVNNEYEITIGRKNNLFKRNKYEVTLKNKNPNTTTIELRAYEVINKPKKFSLGIQIGVSVNKKVRPYLGIGIQYNLLGIK